MLEDRRQNEWTDLVDLSPWDPSPWDPSPQEGLEWLGHEVNPSHGVLTLYLS